jgi:hypothetical protein
MPRRDLPQVDQARSCWRNQLSMQEVRNARQDEQDTVFQRMPEGHLPPVDQVVESEMDEHSFGPLAGYDAVSEFTSRHRHSDFPPLEASGPFDLFPSLPLPAGITPQGRWTDPQWPFAERAGVYLIYSESFELLYIGKSSMNQCLGKRLWRHFGGGEICAPKDAWPQAPRFVVNIAVPEEMPFEAPALEEYLIKKLQPSLNTVGR